MSEIQITRPRDGITVVTMSRPAKLNAMTCGMVEELHGAFSDVSRDRDCRVVILTGEGRGFCAGLDLGGYGTAPGFEWHGRVEKGFAVQKHIASLIPRMRSLPQPVIAAVNGPAAGGGFALVLGSDVRMAAASARFNAAFIRIGLSACDIGTSWLLPRLVGAARAQEIMLTGRIFDADEAARIGLVTDVHPDDALMDAAFANVRWMQVAPAYWEPGDRHCWTGANGVTHCRSSPPRWRPPVFDWVDINIPARQEARANCLREQGFTYQGLRPLRLF